MGRRGGEVNRRHHPRSLRLQLVRSVPVTSALAETGGASPLCVPPPILGRASGLSRRGLLLGTPAVLLGGAGTIQACSQEQAEKLAALIAAQVLELLVDAAVYSLSEEIGGTFDVENASNEARAGEVELEILDGGLEVEDGAVGIYEVPPTTVNTYAWSGLSAASTGDHFANCRTGLNELLSSIFSIDP